MRGWLRLEVSVTLGCGLLEQRLSKFAFTFEELPGSAKYHFHIKISVKTKALSWVHVDPVHQALIDRILGLKESGLNCRQIAAYLNDEGVSSWTGKQLYPQLVFGVIRKTRLKRQRVVDALMEVQCALVISTV